MPLPRANALRRNLHQLVILNIGNRLLQRQPLGGVRRIGSSLPPLAQPPSRHAELDPDSSFFFAPPRLRVNPPSAPGSRHELNS